MGRIWPVVIAGGSALALVGCSARSTQAVSPARQWFLAHEDSINTFVSDMQSATKALSTAEQGSLSSAKVSQLQSACSGLKNEAVHGNWPNPPSGPVDMAYGSMDTDATVFADDCLTFASTADPSTFESSFQSLQSDETTMLNDLGAFTKAVS